MTAPGSEPNTRPAVVDGQVVWLPTLTGILDGAPSVIPTENKQDLWIALAAAVMSEAAFDALDSEMAEGKQLADVIELDAYRPRPHELD